MTNSSTVETSQPVSKPSPKARKMVSTFERKEAKDPMKLLPYLFQFASTRFSEAHSTQTTPEFPQNENIARNSIFLAFRSPSDQLCIIATRSRRTDNQSDNNSQRWMH